MSKIVHPYAHRLIILRDWKSRWFGARKKFRDYLRGDVLIREFLEKKMHGFFVSQIEIERSQKSLRIILRTSRPGLIIGRSGEGAIKLKNEILKMMKKFKIAIPEEVKLDILEIPIPEADAGIVAFMVAEGLEKRMPYRRVIKQTLEKVMATRGVQGARIVLGGRLGGAEIARSEEVKKGSIPLQTFRADIDFARQRAHLPYGDIGIKVWIYRGQIFSAKGGSASGRDEYKNNPSTKLGARK
ncbi:MAG TPA: 30S ribosomal protein S3 [Candidatus Paceibacterota bacterium]|uniref:Small ribosomal subunit protein uS3 n=1 Tax=uncultured Parcubacteria bacterium Rifle_16ft_4_minimus_2958 TaxID=1665137 RepID=A0A0H4T2I5_9BACT|nr:30S ribosomal protein S3, small subunit ribosomal protein S3 [uncultured Parcubacteria bacterium Rifle_16ft_4_minimus_2958]